MFTKLIFNIDGNDVVLHSHEVVQIIIDLTSGESGIPPETILEPNSLNQSIEIMQNFNFVELWHQGMLDNLIFVPAHIGGIQSLKQWLFIAKYCAANKDRKDIHGWWFVIASRLIHLDLADKFWYVSEHGILSDIIRDVQETAIDLPWITNPQIMQGILKLKQAFDGYTILFIPPQNEAHEKTIYLYLETQVNGTNILKYKVIGTQGTLVTRELTQTNMEKKYYNSIRQKVASKKFGQRLTLEEKMSLITTTFNFGDTKSFSDIEREVKDIKNKYARMVISDSYETVKILDPSKTEEEFFEIQEKYRNDPGYVDLEFMRSVEITTYLIETIANKFCELVFSSEDNEVAKLREVYKYFRKEIQENGEEEPDSDNSNSSLGGLSEEISSSDSGSDADEIPFYIILDSYMKRFVLAEISKEINLGKREPLYRPMSSYGRKEIGDAYHEFSLTVQSYFSHPDAISQQAFAAAMRSVISGDDLKDDQLSFLPNLTVAWLIAEGARNHSTILTSMMLVDLIESGVSLRINGFNVYEWRYVLIHPYNAQPTQRVYDLYGDKIPDNSSATGPQRMGGSHSMTHDGSAKQGGKPQGNLNVARQKEGSLILHWLYHHISAINQESAIPAPIKNLDIMRVSRAI